MGTTPRSSEKPPKRIAAFSVRLVSPRSKKAFFMANKLTGRVGLAMNKATDWVVIGISADTRALDEELAG